MQADSRLKGNVREQKKKRRRKEKEVALRLVGGAEMHNGRSHTLMYPLKIKRNILAVEVSAEEEGVPSPYQAPQLSLQCQEKKSPKLLAVKTNINYG